MPHTCHRGALAQPPYGWRISPFTWQCCLWMVLVWLTCLATPRAAHAAELSARHQAVITSMYQPDAVLTEQIHSDFWAGFDRSDPHDPQLPAAMERVAAALQNSLEFERAKALSYQASIQQRKPVVDARYERALQTRLELLRARSLPPDNILAQDKAFRESLVPVSRGKPLDAPSGAKVLMTPALLEQTVKGLEATHGRLERLLNPVWVPAPAGG